MGFRVKSWSHVSAVPISACSQFSAVPFSARSQFSAVPFSACSEFSAVPFGACSEFSAVPFSSAPSLVRYPLVRATSLVQYSLARYPLVRAPSRAKIACHGLVIQNTEYSSSTTRLGSHFSAGIAMWPSRRTNERPRLSCMSATSHGRYLVQTKTFRGKGLQMYGEQKKTDAPTQGLLFSVGRNSQSMR